MSSGFKWKEKTTSSTHDSNDNETKGLSRGYRIDKPREPERPVRENEELADKFGKGYEMRYQRSSNKPAAESNGAAADDSGSVASKFGITAAATAGSAPEKDGGERKKEKKEKRPKVAKPKPTNEPIMRVFVNNRLGTRNEIPCVGSDTIMEFKQIVGFYTGKRAHEIKLQRQGERPFKDMLTLEDYGISNGVQLDLEVDTGD